MLRKHGRFPVDTDPVGAMRLVVVPAGVRVIAGRLSSSKIAGVTTLDAAVARYMDQELGPSCRGITIRSTSRTSALPRSASLMKS